MSSGIARMNMYAETVEACVWVLYLENDSVNETDVHEIRGESSDGHSSSGHIWWFVRNINAN